MDAKSKANFINSVATGQEILCPVCRTHNNANNKLCVTCGFDFEKADLSHKQNAPASETPVTVASAATKYIEPDAVFAKGLPSWDITPPQVMVRRR